MALLHVHALILYHVFAVRKVCGAEQCIHWVVFWCPILMQALPVQTLLSLKQNSPAKISTVRCCSSILPTSNTKSFQLVHDCIGSPKSVWQCNTQLILKVFSKMNLFLFCNCTLVITTHNHSEASSMWLCPKMTATLQALLCCKGLNLRCNIARNGKATRVMSHSSCKHETNKGSAAGNMLCWSFRNLIANYLTLRRRNWSNFTVSLVWTEISFLNVFAQGLR